MAHSSSQQRVLGNPNSVSLRAAAVLTFGEYQAVLDEATTAMTKKILERILVLLAEEREATETEKIGALRAAAEIIAADSCVHRPLEQADLDQ